MSLVLTLSFTGPAWLGASLQPDHEASSNNRTSAEPAWTGFLLCQLWHFLICQIPGHSHVGVRGLGASQLLVMESRRAPSLELFLSACAWAPALLAMLVLVQC